MTKYKKLTLSCFKSEEQQIWKFQLHQISPLHCYVTVYLGGREIGERGCIVEMPQLKIKPIFSRFKRVTCFFTFIIGRIDGTILPFYI